MKQVKHILTLTLAIFFIMSVIALPAFALTSLTSTHYNLIKNMDHLCFQIGTDYMHQVKALQRYLMCFDDECAGLLYYNGQYMDGDFGGRTKAAAQYVQQKLIDDDYYWTGYVGETTWEAIANDLGKEYNKTTVRGDTYILKRWTGSSNIYLTGWDGDAMPALFYFPESGVGSCTFFTS